MAMTDRSTRCTKRALRHMDDTSVVILLVLNFRRDRSSPVLFCGFFFREEKDRQKYKKYTVLRPVKKRRYKTHVKNGKIHETDRRVREIRSRINQLYFSTAANVPFFIDANCSTS